MGLFSWRCAVSGKSIAMAESRLGRDYSECYLVTPTKTYHEKAYSGYGEFGGFDAYELQGRAMIGEDDSLLEFMSKNELRDIAIFGNPTFKIKLVLAQYYTGQKYEELAESEDCPYAGCNFNVEYLLSLGIKEDICEDCGEFYEDCKCDICEECGNPCDYCSCKRCYICGERIADCDCERCPACGELMDDCTCDRCEVCGQLPTDCWCENEDDLEYYEEE